MVINIGLPTLYAMQLESSFIIFIFILLLKIIINVLTGYSDERLRLIIFESVIIIGYEYLSQLRTTVNVIYMYM